MTAPKATLAVERGSCRGSGLCQALAPQLFRLTSGGEAEPVLTELTDDEDIADADAVMSGCPTESVVLTLLD